MKKGRIALKLQEIDQEIDALRRAVGERKARLGQSEELRDAQAVVAAGEQRHAELHKAQRAGEHEAEAIGHKLASEQERLYAGNVRNPKELKGIQEEVDYLRRRSTQVQDELLEVLVEAEDLREQLRAAQGRLAEIEARWAAEQKHLQQELKRHNARYAELMRERAALELQLTSTEIMRYKDLRRRKGAAPVALLQHGNCQACGVTLPLVLARQVPDAEEFIYCPSCGRILVSM